ncbi:MAG: hypothetical protein WDA07_13190 [Leucobacter sp.]
MSYNAIAEMALDSDLINRTAACAATEGVTMHPVSWAAERMWQIAASPGWGAAYAYAVQTGKERPGLAEDVVTDAQILAAVQPLATAWVAENSPTDGGA